MDPIGWAQPKNQSHDREVGGHSPPAHLLRFATDTPTTLSSQLSRASLFFCGPGRHRSRLRAASIHGLLTSHKPSSSRSILGPVTRPTTGSPPGPFSAGDTHEPGHARRPLLVRRCSGVAGEESKLPPLLLLLVLLPAIVFWPHCCGGGPWIRGELSSAGLDLLADCDGIGDGGLEEEARGSGSVGRHRPQPTHAVPLPLPRQPGVRLQNQTPFLGISVV
jgi:hypothetical protein